MATEEPTTADRTDFGEVSRIRGLVFRYLSFGASVFGIVALAALLIYVFIDAFGLANVGPGWLLTYFLTLVLPFVGFCLYSADDRSVTRRVATFLGGGLVVVATVFKAVELVISIPRLNWQLAYLFVVVVPVAAYTAYAVTGTTTTKRYASCQLSRGIETTSSTASNTVATTTRPPPRNATTRLVTERSSAP